MKRVLSFIPLFLIILLSACHSESITPLFQGTATPVIVSRSTNSESALPVGSQILLNAQGGLLLENEIFTYDGTAWTSGQDIQWTEIQTETTITALYPTYTNHDYTSDNLYADGGLEDILIAQATLPGKENIHLQFRHLFSLLTLSFDTDLEENVQDIALSIPVKVSKVSPTDGTLTLADETHTVHQNNNGSNLYSFVVPPSESCTLVLLITLTDNSTHEVTFNPHTFQSGVSYECTISREDSRPGIRNAEDLIAFSQLINGTYTGEQTLADFGEETDGRMIYRLLADITLTEEECSRLSPIGMDSDLPFSDIFDGEGHTLSNLILSDEKYTGLFGHVSSTGTIQNLNISQASLTDPTTSKYTSVIVSNNYGIIDHCSVTNSTLHSVEGGYLGILCSMSAGTIINCHTQNNTVQVNANVTTGAITGVINGKILNCYSYQNKFTTQGSGFRVGGISGINNNQNTSVIRNCYVYHELSTKNWGSAIGTAYKVSIMDFYYNRGNLTYTSNSSTVTSNTAVYDSGFCVNSTPISQLLNEWIETTGSSEYPALTFKKWETAETGAPSLE